MKLGLRKRKRPRRHGNMPRQAATVFYKGHEIRVTETMPGVYVPRVAGQAGQPHDTILDAVADGKRIVESFGTRTAAYSRADYGKRESKTLKYGIRYVDATGKARVSWFASERSARQFYLRAHDAGQQPVLRGTAWPTRRPRKRARA